ncbi:MAG: PadR family transcriptional regulator [Firmicutes bacterium]|nr:PadR family transcriptional regulator [Bacillota bacterium]NBI64275.1 PadR family transcriptional regulator [Clostridiales bacterium]
MLSKPATMLLGLIYEKPLNAYEIIKRLDYMNVKWWFHISDSTVYSTLKVLEKKGFLLGTSEKVGNMPDRTVYRLSDQGKTAFQDTLRASILQFDYDTNIFSIAAFFLNAFPPQQQQELLKKRLDLLQKYQEGIEKQVSPLWESEVSAIHAANVKRMMDLVDAEITGTRRLLESCNEEA